MVASGRPVDMLLKRCQQVHVSGLGIIPRGEVTVLGEVQLRISEAKRTQLRRTSLHASYPQHGPYKTAAVGADKGQSVDSTSVSRAHWWRSQFEIGGITFPSGTSAPA